MRAILFRIMLIPGLLFVGYAQDNQDTPPPSPAVNKSLVDTDRQLIATIKQVLPTFEKGAVAQYEWEQIAAVKVDLLACEAAKGDDAALDASVDILERDWDTLAAFDKRLQKVSLI